MEIKLVGKYCKAGHNIGSHSPYDLQNVCEMMPVEYSHQMTFLYITKNSKLGYSFLQFFDDNMFPCRAFELPRLRSFFLHFI